MKIILSFVFLFIAQSTFTQIIDTIYLDSFWNPIDPGKHRFYRVAEQNDSTIFITDYYKSGKKQMTGNYDLVDYTINNLHSDMEMSGYGTGIFYWYKRNGKIDRYSIYKPFKYPDLIKPVIIDPNMIVDSLKNELTYQVNYFNNGKVKSTGFRFDDCSFYGLGTWYYYLKNGNLSCTTEFKDGEIIKVVRFYSDGSIIQGVDY